MYQDDLKPIFQKKKAQSKAKVTEGQVVKVPSTSIKIDEPQAVDARMELGKQEAPSYATNKESARYSNNIVLDNKPKKAIEESTDVKSMDTTFATSWGLLNQLKKVGEEMEFGRNLLKNTMDEVLKKETTAQAKAKSSKKEVEAQKTEVQGYLNDFLGCKLLLCPISKL